ncbi:hypothetical protein Lser_V15G08624 [Lactuca serriola]
MAGIDIPDNILHNILVRLPAKSLLRFRCVSRHWNRLITDPYFMKSRSRRMIILPTSPLHLIDDNVSTNDQDHSIVKLPFPFRHQEGTDVTVVGTFNGIVLLVLSDQFQNPHMILYNPLTRASKEIPDPPYPFNGATYAFGFGYGATPDDLKIVRIEVHDDFYGDWNTFDVFDLKKSSWITRKDFSPKYGFHEDIGGTFLNGFLYWVAYKYDIVVILCMNIKVMVVSKIDIPDRCHCTLLGSINGCLCIISMIRFNRFDVLLMKEHNSWSKAFSFRFGLKCINWRNLFYPISILDHGRIIMMDGSFRIFIYDTLKRSCKSISLKNFRTIYGIEYIESLVSPSYMCFV